MRTEIDSKHHHYVRTDSVGVVLRTQRGHRAPHHRSPLSESHRRRRLLRRQPRSPLPLECLPQLCRAMPQHDQDINNEENSAQHSSQREWNNQASEDDPLAGSTRVRKDNLVAGTCRQT